MATEYFNDAWRIPNNKNQSLVSNYSMEFDGTNDFVNVGSSAYLNGLQQASFASWVKFDSVDAGNGNCFLSDMNSNITGGGGHFGMVVRKPGGVSRLAFFLKKSLNSTLRIEVDPNTFTTEINTWYHVVMVFDGTLSGPDADNLNRAKIYINGQSKTIFNTGSGTPFYLPTNLSNDTSIINIGRMNDSGNNNATKYFDGQIDQTCIFDYALSASEVSTLYGGGTAVTNPMSLSPKPVAYYQLGDQTASNDTTEPTPPVQSYLVPNNSLQDYVFQTSPAGSPHISIPSITISEAATISIWVNIISFSGGTQQTFFGDQTNTKLVVNNQSGFIRVIYSGESGLGLKITTLVTSDFINKWHHIALVQNGGAATVYIDGNSEGIINPGTLRTPSFAAIGALTGGGATLNGFVSNAAIFSTNLPATGTESIASLYNNGSPALDISSYNGLQRWYKLNAQDTFDGTNWTIKDYANNQDGTSVRMTSANLVQSNLQHTSGYSPYALDFDGTSNFLTLNNASNPQINPTLLGGTTSFTVSAWIKLRINNSSSSILGNYGGGFNVRSFWLFSYVSGQIFFRSRDTSDNQINLTTPNNVTTAGSWQHISVTYDESDIKIFLNGVEKATTSAHPNITINTSIYADTIGSDDENGGNFFDGEISNVAVWRNSVINPVTLYNNGVPANLNNLSTKPSYWFQLGSNSSFNASTGKWTCLNEGTEGTIAMPLNATTSAGNMTEDDITNGVGYSANGLGTSSIEIIGDAPYSTANGLSENMDVLDRTTDVPPTV